MKHLSFLCLACMFIPRVAWGDQPASNGPHVKSGTWGRCYAKSMPEERHGQKGTTRIFLFTEKEDKQVLSFNWYAQQIFLQCYVADKDGKGGISVVRRGPWVGGRGPNAAVMAFTFYLGDKLLKQYTYQDLRPGGCKDPFCPRIEKILGYRWVTSNTYAFEVRMRDKQILSFNAGTGELLEKPK